MGKRLVFQFINQCVVQFATPLVNQIVRVTTGKRTTKWLCRIFAPCTTSNFSTRAPAGCRSLRSLSPPPTYHYPVRDFQKPRNSTTELPPGSQRPAFGRGFQLRREFSRLSNNLNRIGRLPPPGQKQETCHATRRNHLSPNRRSSLAAGALESDLTAVRLGIDRQTELR